MSAAELVVGCHWYALCDRPAAGIVEHPILGDVPTCGRCADRHDLTLVEVELRVEVEP